MLALASACTLDLRWQLYSSCTKYLREVPSNGSRNPAARGTSGIQSHTAALAPPAALAPIHPPLPPAPLAAAQGGDQRHRGTTDMMQPGLTHLHAVSLVGISGRDCANPMPTPPQSRRTKRNAQVIK